MIGSENGGEGEAYLRSAWDHLSEAQQAEIREEVKRGNPHFRRWPGMIEAHCLELMRKRYDIVVPSEVPGVLSHVEAKNGSPPRVFPDWSEPVLEGNGPAPPFPLDVLPPALARFIEEAARVFPSPTDYFAVPALAVAGAAIGRSIALRIKETWVESPVLYAATIGPPGSVKSPALKLMVGPVWKISHEFRAAYDAEVQADQDRRREAREKLKHDKKRGKPSDPSQADEGPRPKLRRSVAENLTCEAISRVLAENPRGLISIYDELSSWINSMNQYKGGSGSDRQFWLMIWAGSPICIDRVGNENNVPILVGHPILPVVGPLTPDMLGSLTDGDKMDGFIDRILFALPDLIQTRWTWREVSPAGPEAWEHAVRKLWSRPLLTDSQGDDRPAFVRFSKHALHRYARWFDQHQQETETDGFPPHLVGAWAKYRAYCARLALILDQLHWAYSDEAAKTQDLPPPRDVRLESVAGAIRLIDEYFKPHFRRTLATLQPERADNLDARAVLDWSVKRGKRTFSARECQSNFRDRFRDRPGDFLTALRWLIQRGALRRCEPPPDRDRTRGGRLPGDRYEVNPHLLT